MTYALFFVAGEPVAQPRLRPRATRQGGLAVHMPRTAEPWRLRCELTARAAWDGLPLDEPLSVGLMFVLPRPMSHWTATGALRKSAPASPFGKPDIDNLIKSTLDAMNGVLWRDDAQVVRVKAEKCYEGRSKPGCWVTVESA